MKPPPGKPRVLVASCLLALAAMAVSSRAAAAPPLPFRGGEELTFQIRWLGLPVAKARLSVEGPLAWEGRQVFRYRLRLTTLGLVHRIYPVKDTAESYADAALLFSHRIDIHQIEGYSYRSHKWFLFEGPRVIYGRPGKPPTHYETPGEVLDALSAFYKIRAQAQRPGEEAEIRVFDRRKTRRVRLRVSREEWLDSLWGPVRTFLVEPEFIEDEALNRKGRAWIWVTADPSRIPVRVESRTFVGPLVAHLIETGGLASGPLARAPEKKLSLWKPSTRIVSEAGESPAQKLKELLDKKQK